MARALARTVTLQDPESRRFVSFTAGEVPPAWAAEQITNEQAWGDDAPAEVDEVEEAGGTSEQVPETPAATTPEDDDGDLPTRSASKADWKAYAISQDMDVDEAEKMTRDDLAKHFHGED